MMKGALPPSSRLTRFTLLVHCCINNRPTRVEPVKESLRTEAFEVNSPPIPSGRPVTMLTTPFGIPARSASTANAQSRLVRYETGEDAEF
jgi:hypothetical protein